MTSNRPIRKSGGFTLIEVAIATVIIAVGVIALMVGVGSSTRINSSGRSLAQAVILAENIREWSIKPPFFDPELTDPGPIGYETGESVVDDLDDLHQTFSPPRDSQGNFITAMANWKQIVTVQWVDDTNLSTISSTATDTVMVAVEIQLNAKPIYTTSWLVARKE